jgi:predicted ATPase/class 3 adenylate cyclase
LAELPSGTVTFLFTDLEGSTRLWDEHPEAMRGALARHDEILRSVVRAHGGQVVKTTGDGLHAVFVSAHDALDAAVGAQQRLFGEVWGSVGPLRVRMGVHTCEAERRDGDYYGSSVNRAARLMSAAHGGQVVVSRATAELTRDGEWELVDLGEHRLQDLARGEQVFQLLVPGSTVTFPPLRSLDALPGNLPQQLTSFVGRDDEVRAVRSLLDDRRLVTLTGVGGVGKTRLALQVAAEALVRFRHGAWFVELAQVREPGAVAEAVAGIFGLKLPGSVAPERALADSMRTRRLLLVVDNCEHLLGPVSVVIAELLRQCPGVTVLATSREALGIAGEQVVGVGSLDVPSSSAPDAVAACEAVRLFVERAEATGAAFELDDRNAAAVVEVVRRLDGIPLAIELAAARVGVLSPSQIAQRLDQRFRLLAGGTRGAIERHATLRAAVDWSYELLNGAEQKLLARLAIFAGGCTLEAAEQVCSDDEITELEVLDLLSSLVARSLVVSDVTDLGDRRYRLLETIRQYAEEQLDDHERDVLGARHADHYVEFLEHALIGSRGPQPAEWLGRCELEVENVRNALTWAVGRGDAALTVRMLEALEDPLYFFPVAQVARAFRGEFVDLARANPQRSPLPLLWAAFFAHDVGDVVLAAQLGDEALGNGEPASPRIAVWGAMLRATLALTNGDVASCVAGLDQAIAAAERYDLFEAGWMLANIVGFRAMVGRQEAAARDAESAVAAARRLDSPLLTAYALGQAAYALALTDAGRAHGLLLESVRCQEAVGTRYVDDNNLIVTATVGALVGESDIACRAAAVVLERGTTILATALSPLVEAVAACVAKTMPADAAVVHGAVDALLPGMREWGMWGVIRERAEAQMATTLSPEEIELRRALGAAMTLDQISAFVAELVTNTPPSA